MNTIHITAADQGEHLLVGGDVATIKATSATTSDSMLVFELRVPAGGGPPMLHRHSYAEIFYLLDGTFEISTLGPNNRLQTVAVSAGDTVAIPSMAWHTFKNVGATIGKLLTVHSPPIMETLIREIGQPVTDPRNPPAPDGPRSAADRDRFMQMIGKYMELLPPDAIAR